MKTSEEKLGITDPSDYQCDLIDGMANRARDGMRFTSNAMHALDPQTIIQANKEAYLRLVDIPEEMEQFRTAIETVRLWGDGWKTLAKQLIEKYEPALLQEPVEFDDIPF